MFSMIEPIEKTQLDGLKPTKKAITSLIMVDGKYFKSQGDADEYIRKRNLMTPEQLKREADNIAFNKSNQRQNILLGTLKSTAQISLVPLGLAYFAYYQKYSLTKGIGVVLGGSIISYYAFIFYAFAGNPFSNKGKSVKVLKQ